MPTTVGVYPYTAQVTDSVASTATVDCSITITGGGDTGGIVYYTPCSPIPTLEVTRDLDADWDDESTFYITQDEPLPFTLRGLVMRMSFNPD
jgi:hypothetical protein